MQERIEARSGRCRRPAGRRHRRAVRVSLPGVGGEEPVVGQERWEEMHRLKAAGMTVSGVARATGLDRKTVRRCLRQSALAGVPAAGEAGGLDFTRKSGHQHLRFLRSRMEVSDAKDSEAAVHG